MDYPHLVFTGGADGEPFACLYIGTDGDAAQRAFNEAGADGRNETVRFCQARTFMHTQIRTPKRDGVPPKPKPALPAKGKGKAAGGTSAAEPPPAPPQAPAASEEETHADDSEDSGI